MTAFSWPRSESALCISEDALDMQIPMATGSLGFEYSFLSLTKVFHFYSPNL